MSQVLRDLTDYLKKEEEESRTRKEETKQLPPDTPFYVAIVVEAFDHALDMTGRIGKDVLYTILEQRHDIRPIDIPFRPGEFVSALRSLLESSALVIESYMLAHIKEMTGVSGWSLEE